MRPYKSDAFICTCGVIYTVHTVGDEVLYYSVLVDVIYAAGVFESEQVLTLLYKAFH